MGTKKQQKGPCYFCGREMAKGYMGRHLLAEHIKADDDQACWLLKIEDEYRNYWLFIDIPVNSSLSTLDNFLRNVWLECCGHLSAFMPVRSYGDDYGMNRKLGSFLQGEVMEYEYDFGSTTTLYITFVQRTTRKKQKAAVRVLSRNNPYVFTCERCGKPATQIDTEEWPAVFYCDQCAGEIEEEGYFLPVVNSPRMGVCAYCGEYDTYAYKKI